MIPISEYSGELHRKTALSAFAKTLSCLAFAILVSGCTNSKLIIGPLYNQLDDRMRKQFNELGDFNARQTAAFEASLGTYHVWHRQSELPQYAALMEEIANSINTDNTTYDKVGQWMRRAEVHSLAVRECHPVNFLFDMMRSLSDTQIDVIEQKLKKRQKKYRERNASRTPEQLTQQRLKNLEKWAGRLDLKITEEQRELLQTAFTEQKSLRPQYQQLSADWKTQFFNLARNQNASNHDELMRSHFSKFWTLLQSNHPEQWQQNRDMWMDVAFRFEQSMTSNQRIQFSRWISKMAGTLRSVSEDKPSFKIGDDPSVGCLVDQQASQPG